MTAAPSASGLADSVLAAYERIRDSVRLTPVEDLSSIGASHGTRAFAKMENLQLTGSFKLRGATNRIMQLSAAGQGTVAVELLEQLPPLDAVFIATGGGGLLSGMGAWIKHASPRTSVVGCWPFNSRVLYECIRSDAVIDFPEQPTLSDSTAGGVELGSMTLPLAHAVLDRSILVSEEEILAALRWARRERGWLIEGAAAVALAAYLKTASDWAGGTVAVIVCGGNLSDRVRNIL